MQSVAQVTCCVCSTVIAIARSHNWILVEGQAYTYVLFVTSPLDPVTATTRSTSHPHTVLCSQLGRTFESVSRPIEAIESYRVAISICNNDGITTLAACLALGNLHLVCLDAIAAASCFEQALTCLSLLKVRLAVFSLTRGGNGVLPRAIATICHTLKR